MSTILMIDDDKEFCGLISTHFSGLGYTVALTHNWKDGLAKAGVLKPDIVFLDVMMPDMNGIEVLRELQAAEETSDIPVMIISGKYFDPAMSDLFSQERNFRVFLSKPVTLSDLQKKVEAFLK